VGTNEEVVIYSLLVVKSVMERYWAIL